MTMVKKLLPMILAALVNGCGYGFQGGGSVLPPDVKSVAIPLVENSSTEAGLGTVMTEALRDQFDRFGVVTVLEESGGADAVLRARILSVDRRTSTTTSTTDAALQQDTVLTLAAELRRSDGPVLWRNPALTVTKPFAATRGVVVTSSAAFSESSLGAQDLEGLGTREVSRGQEQEALQDLAQRAARIIYDQAVAPDF